MHKKFLVGGGILVVIVAAVAVVLVMNHTNVLAGETYAQAKASAPANKPACLAKSNPAVSAANQNKVEMSIISHLYDVPAGTNVDVNVASYTATKVTGSEVYDNPYGSYNFTLSKTGKSNDLQVTAFTACK